MNNSNTSKARGGFVLGLPPSTSSPISSNSSLSITSSIFLASHLLIGVSVFIFCGLIVTYSLAVTSGHVKTLLCFISYTGDFPIESCIFSFTFCFSSLIYFIIIYLRFAQISQAIQKQNLPKNTAKKMNVCNEISLLLGLFGAFGLNMTGCFQRRLLHSLHLIGVALCTYISYLYFTFQAYFSFRLSSLVTHVFTKGLRLLMIVLSGCILSVAPIFPVYLLMASSNENNLAPVANSGSKNVLLSIAACLEWTLFFTYQVLLYSFYPDLKKIALQKNQIIFLE